MTKIRVVVTGLGAVCSLGHDVNTIWESVIAGRSNMSPITTFDVSTMRTKFAAQIEDYDVEGTVDTRTAQTFGTLCF